MFTRWNVRRAFWIHGVREWSLTLEPKNKFDIVDDWMAECFRKPRNGRRITPDTVAVHKPRTWPFPMARIVIPNLHYEGLKRSEKTDRIAELVSDPSVLLREWWETWRARRKFYSLSLMARRKELQLWILRIHEHWIFDGGCPEPCLIMKVCWPFHLVSPFLTQLWPSWFQVRERSVIIYTLQEVIKNFKYNSLSLRIPPQPLFFLNT